jgi:SAM-dependent methyltransferase
LLSVARELGVCDALPASLSFEQSGPSRIPAAADTYDVVLSSCMFEHASDVDGMMREIARVLRPTGVFYLDVWPLYYSEHGGHVWPWYPGEPFPHLARRRLAAEAESLHRTTNRLTLARLQKAMRPARLATRKLYLYGTGPVHIPDGLDRRHSLADLGIGGVRLLATHG